MIPKVFISSTIEDLHHLRDVIRDTVRELGYQPVLSEYGGVGFQPAFTAEDSCYAAMKECQLAILVVGKRYGSTSSNGISVTHNEFRAAKDSKIPVFILVEAEVLAFRRVFLANPQTGNNTEFPGMDQAQKTFSMIQDIAEARQNNAILQFTSVPEARAAIVNQIAHLFGTLLASQMSPISGDIKDVLAEIKTLRHEMATQDSQLSPNTEEVKEFMRLVRFLVGDDNRTYKDFIERNCGGIEEAAKALLKSKNFDEFLQAVNVKIEISEIDTTITGKMPEEMEFMSTWGWGPPPGSAVIQVFHRGIIKMNKRAKEWFDFTHNNLVKAVR